MLTRRHIRVKVMQAIYALSQCKSDDIAQQEKFILTSVEDMSDLYFLKLSLLRSIHQKAVSQQQLSEKKYVTSPKEKKLNQGLIRNSLLQQLFNNPLITKEIKDRKINDWQLNENYIKILYQKVVESDLYTEYSLHLNTDYEEDKSFLIAAYKDIIAPNDKLYEYIEGVKLTWLDDLPLVNTYLIKQLKKSKKNQADNFFIPTSFKSIEDKEFASGLLKKTLLNNKKLLEEITDRTENWDKDRIAYLDSILLQMGISELLYFPTIPTKVTINEYLEIAKEYSTPKSSIFINGILDKLIKEYTHSKRLNKTGRGLI